MNMTYVHCVCPSYITAFNSELLLSPLYTPYSEGGKDGRMERCIYGEIDGRTDGYTERGKDGDGGTERGGEG